MERLVRKGAILGLSVLMLIALDPERSLGRGDGRSRMLSFAERVAYQRAMEEVRWRHRIWPKENPGSKPPLEASISQRQIEQKVEAYLWKSQLVARQRGLPITASELQAEMERMAGYTRRPDVLGELFAALGNDPFVVAECLAKPLLAERLVAGPTLVASLSPAPRSLFAADAAASTETVFTYRLPEILDGCTDDTWTATTTVNTPEARADHTVVWTGSEMIVWGGAGVNILNTGGKYDPAEDAWTPTSTVNAPARRLLHAAVWTGSEMIVWGGQSPSLLNTGGRYNPATDSWTATSTVNAPTARIYPTGVWTGSEMIVWGGRNGSTWFNTGARYDPNTDSWTATSTLNAPERRWYHTALWTGSEMIVWGGTNQTIYLNTGGKYNPTQDSWMATSTANAPLGRVAHTSIWRDGEMDVWGGGDSTFNDCNTGGRYNPTADSWTATSTLNAPSPREAHTAVWDGVEMIVWGGIFCFPCMDFNTGGRYNPGTDSWVPTSTASAPFARERHTAVWTGSEMIAWGGYNYAGNLYLNTGGRYCAPPGPTPTPTATATPTTTPSATPTATVTPTATATPTAAITPSATPTATPTPTARPTPTPRPNVTPRVRPTPPPRP